MCRVRICCRFAHTRLADRDGAQFNLEPAELRRRRLIFWELYKLDAWIVRTAVASPIC